MSLLHRIKQPPGTPVQPDTGPIQQYARNALKATEFDQRAGVLQWRIGERLLNHFRRRQGHDAIRLEAASRPVCDWVLDIARELILLHEDIDGARKPTGYEVYRYELRKSIDINKARAMCEAERRGHALGEFGPGALEQYESAACRFCFRAVTISLQDASLSFSAELQGNCKRRCLEADSRTNGGLGRLRTPSSRFKTVKGRMTLPYSDGL